MQNDDYDIKTGGIEPRCEEDIIEKKKVITGLYRKSYTALLAKANRFFPGSTQEQQDAIQEFFTKKICPKEIGRLKEIEEIGISYIVGMFNNYLIDIIRKKDREREAIEAYIIRQQAIRHDEDRDISLGWIPIEERLRVTIKRYKKIIAANFRNPQYADIFELIILGYTNPEIAEILDINPSTVGTARHRIRKFMNNRKQQE